MNLSVLAMPGMRATSIVPFCRDDPPVENNTIASSVAHETNVQVCLSSREKNLKQGNISKVPFARESSTGLEALSELLPMRILFHAMDPDNLAMHSWSRPCCPWYRYLPK